MRAKFFEENYVILRKTYPRLANRPTRRLEVAEPANETEFDYRDLLSEANENYFHREYTIALQNYLALRAKILEQSHPEMPSAGGGGSYIDPGLVNIEPLFELSRKYLDIIDPGGPVELNLDHRTLVDVGQFKTNPALAVYSTLGMDPQLATKQDLGGVRQSARGLILEGDLAGAQTLYTRAKEEAIRIGDYGRAADLVNESAAMTATYAAGGDRRQALATAAAGFREADALYKQVGDAQGRKAARANLEQITPRSPGLLARFFSFIGLGSSAADGASLNGRAAVNLDGASLEGANAAAFTRTLASAGSAPTVNLPAPQTTAQMLVRGDGAGGGGGSNRSSNGWSPAAFLLASGKTLRSRDRQVGLFTSEGVRTVSLGGASYARDVTAALYSPRVEAVTAEGINFYEEIETNFVAYIPHLYFFVLPMAVGDTYHALGRYQQAIAEYQTALAYTFLNLAIEVPFIWLRMAKVYMRWGDDLFRQDRPAEAKTQYEKVVRTNLSVPLDSPLYQPSVLAPMRGMVGEVVKKLKGQPHGAFNPKVGELVTQAVIQLRKIAEGLNFLGLADDFYPVFRYKYLQAVANYMADNAVQAERTFINFRVAAENQKMERLQLENTVAVSDAALAVEKKRLEDADLERTAAGQNLAYTEQRRTHAQEALDEWNTKGWELATINAALAWAGNAANDQDITYTGVQYDGKSHDFDTDVEEFFDVVGEWRENLTFELQQNRLERQRDEMDSEVALAQTRRQQAQVRYEIQQLSIDVAQLRLDGAKEMLDYANERMFDEDLWFRLAAELQDMSRHYLDMAVYAAFLMERAYELEFDRNLRRIRLDYGIGGVENLLGGDYLKNDIASFTLDYLENAQKKNPVRLSVSLRDEFPSAFQTFVQTGILPFRTDLEIFDRRFPGTFRRKLKKVEVFVEGLIPLEGVNGTLLHQGISTEWRRSPGGDWAKYSRVLPAERMVLSSYQFRRDITVFQPSEEMLGQFENLGPQGNWTLALPRSGNNLDYEAVSDIKLALYFDADYSDDLADHVAGLYSNTGGRALILSSRFHFPDQYFRLDADRRVTFQLHPSRFAYNYTNLRLRGFGVRLRGRDGSGLGAQQIRVTRESDNSFVDGTTGADGSLQGAQATMAPFGAWRDQSPVDSFTVALGGAVDETAVGDIELFVDYAFTYRADGSLTA